LTTLLRPLLILCGGLLLGTGVGIAAAGVVSRALPLQALYLIANREGDFHIYALDVERGLMPQVIEEAVSPSNLLLSPDGTKVIFFVSKGTTSFELIPYVMDWNGANARPLPIDIRDPNDLSWSPDGSHLAFTAAGEDGRDIYLMAADCLMNQSGCAGAVRRLTTDQVDNLNPSWSPDGQMIAYSASQGSQFDLYVVSIADGKSRQLTSQPTDELGPRWTPDGQLIQYTAYSRGLYANQYLIPAQGGVAQPLTQGFAASWSPDGRWLAYGRAGRLIRAAEGRTEETEVVAEYPRGTRLWSLTWSPDGAELVYLVDAGKLSPQVYLLEQDGVPRRLTFDEAAYWSPAWWR
jgi:Tol biopolymer transport system component